MVLKETTKFCSIFYGSWIYFSWLSYSSSNMVEDNTWWLTIVIINQSFLWLRILSFMEYQSV